MNRYEDAAFARARRDNPETAKAAARNIDKRLLTKINRRIVEYLERNGPSSATEIADELRLDRQSVSNRPRILEEAGFVVEHGRKENPTSGVTVIAWRAARPGETILKRPRHISDAALLDKLEYYLFDEDDGPCDAFWYVLPKKLRIELDARRERRAHKRRRAGMSS